MTQARKKDQKSFWIFGIPLLAVVAVAAFFILRPLFSGGDAATMDAQPVSGGDAGVESETAPPEPGDNVLEERWIEATGKAPVWPTGANDPKDCTAVVEDLRTLCRRLDGRPYVHSWNLPSGTCGLLGDLAVDLDERPPTLDGIFDSIGSFRANVTHFYAVLGEKKLQRVASLVREEPELAEPMAMALYRWARSAKKCRDVSPAPPSVESQYAYATFLVNTIGGQAYLRRRAPRLEALTSLYALLVLDHAVESGYNPAGVDLRPEIDRSIALIGTQDLLFQDQYLQMLQEMKIAWEVRAREAG
jgi:hypothetical protein